MKKLFLLLLLLPFLGLSQGLNYDTTFNQSYHQTPAITSNSSEYSYLGYQVKTPEGNKSIIAKQDTFGNTLWEKQLLAPLESSTITSINELDNNNILISGYGLEDCNFNFTPTTHVRFYTLNSNGAILDTFSTKFKDYFSFYYFGNPSISFNTEINNIVYGVKKYDTTIVYKYNYNNYTVDSSKLIVNHNSYSKLHTTNNNAYILAKSDSIFKVIDSAQIVRKRFHYRDVDAILNRNDSIFVFTRDSLTIYDYDLNRLFGKSIYHSYEIDRVLVDSSGFFIVRRALDYFKIFEMDNTFQVTETLNFTIQNFEPSNPYSFSRTQLSQASNHGNSEFPSVRHTNYSLKSNYNNSIFKPIVHLDNIESVYYDSIQNAFSNQHYNFSLGTKILVNNFNNPDTLRSIRVNHYINSYGNNCEDNYYTKLFTNLSIPPDSSRWIFLDTTYFENIHLPASQSQLILFDFTVNIAHPNYKLDKVTNSNTFTKIILMGYASTEEQKVNKINLYPNPTSDHITITSDHPVQQYKVYNTMGQQVQAGKVKDSRIEVETIPSGYYIIELKIGDQLISDQLISEKLIIE